MLFGAGAIVAFITVWGVVMAGGVFATRPQPLDDAVAAPQSTPAVTGPVAVEPQSAVSPSPLRVVDG